MRDPCEVQKKLFGKWYARARCMSPLKVKVGSDALLGPKHAGLGRDSLSSRWC